jgi:hypothetical protein
MNIITKDNTRNIRLLSSDERQSLVEFFANASTDMYYQKTAQAVLNEAKTLDAWLLCDCAPDCYLFPRRTENSITLVRPRPPRQHPHGADCPFYLPAMEDNGTKDTQSVETLNEMTNFCLIKQETVQARAPQIQHELSTTQLTKSVPSLTKVLFTLIQRAGLNISNNHFPINDHYRAIYRVATQTPMWPGSKMVLSDVLSTLTTPSHLFGLYKRLRLAKFGSGHKKQGYAISLAKSVELQSVTLCFGQTVNVVGKINAPSRTPTGPYWVIFLITETKEGSGFFEAVRASLWPAYSENLPFPVDSDPERQTFRDLLSWRLYWKDKGEDFEIEKPLDFTNIVRPDFLVKDPESGRAVVIETMGSKDAAYLSNKESMHQRMAQQYGDVIEHRPGDDSFVFKKAITKHIMS